MADKVLAGLYVGDAFDAASFDGEILCVLEGGPVVAGRTHYWQPILDVEGHQPIARRELLDAAAEIIEDAQDRGVKLLVHCGAGIERSPLTIAWFLHRRRGLSLDEAYALVQAARPQVADRRAWIETGG